MLSITKKGCLKLSVVVVGVISVYRKKATGATVKFTSSEIKWEEAWFLRMSAREDSVTEPVALSSRWMPRCLFLCILLHDLFLSCWQYPIKNSVGFYQETPEWLHRLVNDLFEVLHTLLPSETLKLEDRGQQSLATNSQRVPTSRGEDFIFSCFFLSGIFDALLLIDTPTWPALDCPASFPFSHPPAHFNLSSFLMQTYIHCNPVASMRYHLKHIGRKSALYR